MLTDTPYVPVVILPHLIFYLLSVQELTSVDDDEQLGHLGLALNAYCQIAALFVRNREDENKIKITTGTYGVSVSTPLEAADQIFFGTYRI